MAPTGDLFYTPDMQSQREIPTHPAAPRPERVSGVSSWLTCLLLWLLVSPAALSAQGEDLRIGITLGGTSFLGLAVEFFDGDRSLEIAVGTWTARDLSVSVVGRQYFGAAEVKPVVGAGLWSVFSWPEDEGTGISLVARAPVGFDWNVAGDHSLNLDINVNRALWVKRPSPTDATQRDRSLVPLPGISYRWRP